jgi:hypothetical protein
MNRKGNKEIYQNGTSMEQEKIRFEVFAAVTMKNGVFWVVTPCGSCKNPEDTILHSHRRENLKSYLLLFL